MNDIIKIKKKVKSYFLYFIVTLVSPINQTCIPEKES